MATKPTPPKQPPKIVLTWPMLLPYFQGWATTHPGQTQEQLIRGFTSFYVVSDTDIKALRDYIKGKPPEKPPTPPEKPPEKPKPKEPTVPKELIIERTPYPKWWKDSLAWNINIDMAGTWPIINPTPSYFVYIGTIVLTVDGETAITFEMGVFGSSGTMNFGGEGQPMGISISMGNSPMPCGEGGFKITSSEDDVHVGGFIVYYREKI